MWIQDFFQSVSATERRRRHRPRGLLRRLEVLEDRLLLSAFVIDLGGFEANDINGTGQVVGNSGPRAFIWQDGVKTDLGTLGGHDANALGINDAGQVVGNSSVSPASAVVHAFLLTPEDTDGNGVPDLWYRDTNGDGRNDLMRDLGTLGGTSSRAVDINNVGQVVGTAATASGSDHAFIWQDGQIRDLGTLGGSTSSANAINNAGQVTGMATAADGSFHAFLWQGGVMTDFGGGTLNDINSVGQIAGSGYGGASLWTPRTPNGTSGTFTNLGFLPPTSPSALPTSIALGLNSAGQVVGISIDIYNYGANEYGPGGYVEFPRAFVWTDGVLQNLNDLVPPAAADFWLQSASAINDAGQIVGVGQIETGLSQSETHVFLYTPVNLALPLISVDNALITEGNSGTTDAVFNVSLSRAGTETVTVAYTTVDGTAVAGSDYLATSGTLTFAPGQTSQSISVPVIGDRTPGELVETFFVRLSSPSNVILADARGYGNIIDDEPRISGNSITVQEGNSGTVTALVTLSLSTAYDQAVTVTYATVSGTATAGSDYLSTSGTVTFAPGQTTQQIPVTVQGDRISEPHYSYYGTSYTEYFALALSNPSSNAVAYGGGSVTIQDDEPLISISPQAVTVTEGNSGTTDAVFTVSLSAPYDQEVTVGYFTGDGCYNDYYYYYCDAANAGSDYLATSGTLRFAAGQTTQSITVPVIGDVLPESTEYYLLVLLNPSSNATIIDDGGVGFGVILDDEPPALSIDDVSRQEGNSGTTSFTFTVTLSFASTQTVTVSFATANKTATAGADYQAASGTLTFAPGEISKTVTVLVNGDRLPEPNEAFDVKLSAATNATIADGQGVGTILDDEPRVSISNVTKAEGRRKRTLFSFTITLSAAYDQPVTMSFRTLDGTAMTSDDDYVAKTGTLTFNPGETQKTITIEVKGDKKKEANETFYLDLFGLSSNALFSKDRGIGTILNDD